MYIYKSELENLFQAIKECDLDCLRFSYLVSEPQTQLLFPRTFKILLLNCYNR